jgi:hypothetical protein
MRGRFRPRLIALDCGKSNLDVGRGMPNQKHLARWTVKAAARPRKIWRLPALSYGYLRLHPDWDPLRGDPRFEKLVEEAKKPVALK